MKNTLPQKENSILNIAIHKIILIPLIGFLIFLNSCHKDERQNDFIQQTSNQTSALQSTAYSVLKAHASASEFNDLDWSNTTIRNLNGKPYLLSVKSKSDNTKFLFTVTRTA